MPSFHIFEGNFFAAIVLNISSATYMRKQTISVCDTAVPLYLINEKGRNGAFKILLFELNKYISTRKIS